MSSVNTSSALVLRGDFNADSRQYPVWAFFEMAKDWFDSRDHDAKLPELYTESASFHTPHADRHETHDPTFSEEHAFTKGTAQFYTDPLGEHRHVNETAIALESASGWEIYAQMVVYANIAGTPTENETKIKDEKGTEWCAEIPIYYHFVYVKDETAKYYGLKIKHVSVIKDTGIINDRLDARGLGHKKSIN